VLRARAIFRNFGHFQVRPRAVWSDFDFRGYWKILSQTTCPRAGCQGVVYWPICMEHIWYSYIDTCPCVIVERSRRTCTWLTWSRLLHVHVWCSEEARSGSYHGARSLDLCTITRTRDNRNLSNMFYIHCSINHTLSSCSGACCLTIYLSIPPKIKIGPQVKFKLIPFCVQYELKNQISNTKCIHNDKLSIFVVILMIECEYSLCAHI